MKIRQFEDKGLSHFSYAILSETENEIILVDPGRNPEQYYDHAHKLGSRITAVIETHPHADFVSSHLEIHKTTGALIYVSKLVGANYPHQAFDEGHELNVGELKLRAINTPGHSPDSICIVAAENGIDRAVFTGDTLFIGDVGRPDLRENVGNMRAKREELAKQMYNSIHNKLLKLDDHVKVYPAHGAGSLCGKALSDASSSTMLAEKSGNYALQQMSEEAFVKELLSDQPFIPKYFSFNVDLNKQGAPDHKESKHKVRLLGENFIPEEGAFIVDVREEAIFKKSHIAGAFNIMDGDSFETWLGSIIAPSEAYYLVAGNTEQLETVIEKACKIGYEMNIKGAFVYNKTSDASSPVLDTKYFRENPDQFHIIDIRNKSELENGKIFPSAENYPLHELRETADKINTDKDIVVHCAGGYRSAAGASILETKLNGLKVFDLSTDVSDF